LGGDVLGSMVKSFGCGRAIVTEVGKDKFASGYSSIGFLTSISTPSAPNSCVIFYPATNN
jgi:hypothetical protein